MDKAAPQSELRVVPLLDPDDFKLRLTDLKFIWGDPNILSYHRQRRQAEYPVWRALQPRLLTGGFSDGSGSSQQVVVDLCRG